MQVSFRRSAEWRQQQAMILGDSVPETQVVEFGPDDVKALPDDVRALCIIEGQVMRSVEFALVYGEKVQLVGQAPYSGRGYEPFRFDSSTLNTDEFAAMVRRAVAVVEVMKAKIIEEDAEREATLKAARAKQDREGRESKAANAARAAEESVNQMLRTSELAAHVQRIGSDTLKRKWAAGLAPHKEVIDLVLTEQSGFIPADLKFVHTECKIVEDPEHEDGCYAEDNEKVEYEDVARTSLTDEQFVNYERLQKALPAGTTIQTMMEIAKCPSCQNKARTVYARCEWKVGTIDVGFDVVLG